MENYYKIEKKYATKIPKNTLLIMNNIIMEFDICSLGVSRNDGS